jgi:hypothetical protein
MNFFLFRHRNATTTFSIERLLIAGSLVAAFAIMAVALVLGTGSGDSRDVAGCTVSRSGTSSAISCSPDYSPGGISGAPTQEEITAKNAQRAHYGSLGGLF